MVYWGCMMKTKVCPGCNKELPVSEFWKAKSRPGGLQCYCKKCQKKKMQKRYLDYLERNRKHKERIALRMANRENLSKALKPFTTDVLGGFKITVLNYIKKGEKKYNVLPIGGELFATNSKQKFMDYLEAI